MRVHVYDIRGKRYHREFFANTERGAKNKIKRLVRKNSIELKPMDEDGHFEIINNGNCVGKVKICDLKGGLI